MRSPSLIALAFAGFVLVTAAPAFSQARDPAGETSLGFTVSNAVTRGENQFTIFAGDVVSLEVRVPVPEAKIFFVVSAFAADGMIDPRTAFIAVEERLVGESSFVTSSAVRTDLVGVAFNVQAIVASGDGRIFMTDVMTFRVEPVRTAPDLPPPGPGDGEPAMEEELDRPRAEPTGERPSDPFLTEEPARSRG